MVLAFHHSYWAPKAERDIKAAISVTLCCEMYSIYGSIRFFDWHISSFKSTNKNLQGRDLSIMGLEKSLHFNIETQVLKSSVPLMWEFQQSRLDEVLVKKPITLHGHFADLIFIIRLKHGLFCDWNYVCFCLNSFLIVSCCFVLYS